MSKLLGSTMTTNNTSPEEANNDTIVTSVPLNDGISSLRQRNVNSSGRSSTKRKKKTLKWISSSDNYTLPTPAEAEVFMTMQLRKMRRRVHGRKVKGSMAAECGFLFCMLIIIFIIAVFRFGEEAEEDGEEETIAPTSTGMRIAAVFRIRLTKLPEKSTPRMIWALRTATNSP